VKAGQWRAWYAAQDRRQRSGRGAGTRTASSATAPPSTARRRRKWAPGPLVRGRRQRLRHRRAARL